MYGAPKHNLLGSRINSSNPTWESIIETKTDPFIADHIIQGAAVFPGAGYIEMALAAVQELDETKGNIFSSNLDFGRPEEGKKGLKTASKPNKAAAAKDKVRKLAPHS